jgi:hypothetical protein
MVLSLVRVVSPFDSGLVAANAVREETGNATDRRYADAGKVVNPTVGQSLFEIGDDLPAINERLEFGGSAEVLQETAALVDRLETDQGFEEVVLGTFLFAASVVSIRFHQRMSVLTRYYTNTGLFEKQVLAGNGE